MSRTSAVARASVLSCKFILPALTLLGAVACGGASAGTTVGNGGTALPVGNPALASLTDDGTFQGTVLSLKYVSYMREDGKPVLSKEQAVHVVKQVNGLYERCGIRFRLEEYVEAESSRYGLPFNVNSVSSMDSIRTPFASDRSLVVVNTGDWDQSRMGSANAWTAMPGEHPLGAVLESVVADNANIAAHELGHYLGLDHVSDSLNLMNPIIYGNSIQLTESQCEGMRATAQSVHTAALR
jgi:hypothetical protein